MIPPFEGQFMQIERMASSSTVAGDLLSSVLQTQDLNNNDIDIARPEDDLAIINIDSLRPIIPGSPSDKVFCIACGGVHSHHDECQ